MNKGLLFSLLSIPVGIGLLIWTFQLFPLDAFYNYLRSISPLLLFLYLCVSFVIFLLLTLRWHIILKGQGFKIPYRKTLAYRYVGFAASFLTPGPRVGGEPLRAAFVADGKENFPQAMSTVIADKTIELTSFGVLFVIGLAYTLISIPLQPNVRAVLILAFVILVAILGYVVFNMVKGRDPVTKLLKFFRLNKLQAAQKYEAELQEFEHTIKTFYTKQRQTFLYATLLTIIAWLLSLVEFWLIMRMLGIHAGIGEVFLVYSAVGFAYLIPIPFALGVLDALQIAVFAALGFPEAAGVATALITRGRDVLWMIVGFILLTGYGINYTKQLINSAAESRREDTEKQQ